MKHLLLTLCLLFASSAKSQYCFTREELQMAADSALKGMAAVRSEADLRKAAQLHARAISGYLATITRQDTIIASLALRVEQQEVEMAILRKASNERGAALLQCKDDLSAERKGRFWRGLKTFLGGYLAGAVTGALLHDRIE